MAGDSNTESEEEEQQHKPGETEEKPDQTKKEEPKQNGNHNGDEKHGEDDSDVDILEEVPADKDPRANLTDQDYFEMSSAEIMTHYPPMTKELSSMITYKCIKTRCIPKLEDVAKTKDPVIKETFANAKVWRPKPPRVIKNYKPRKPRAPRKKKEPPKPVDMNNPDEYFKHLMRPGAQEEMTQIPARTLLKMNQVKPPPWMMSNKALNLFFVLSRNSTSTNVRLRFSVK
jgi:hypothetical protein